LAEDRQCFQDLHGIVVQMGQGLPDTAALISPSNKLSSVLYRRGGRSGSSSSIPALTLTHGNLQFYCNFAQFLGRASRSPVTPDGSNLRSRATAILQQQPVFERNQVFQVLIERGSRAVPGW